MARMILDDVFTPPRRPQGASWYKRKRTLLFGGATALCVAVGAVSLRYLLPALPAPAPLPNVLLNRHVLIVHASFAAGALLLVPVQLWTAGRGKIGFVHRLSGYTAMLVIYVAALAALWIAPTARGGLITSLGFASLAAAWLIGVTIGLISVPLKAYDAHRRWMIRVAALTFAAVTLRIYMPISLALHIDYNIAYRIVSWLCWLPNLGLVEVWIRSGEARYVAIARPFARPRDNSARISFAA